MRKLLLIGLGLAAIVATAGVAVLVAKAPAPHRSPSASANLPPAPAAQAVPAAEPPPPPPVPPVGTLPDLPVAEVSPRVTHEVPEHEIPPTPHVTFQDIQGRALAHGPASRSSPSQSAVTPSSPPTQSAALAPLTGAAQATGPVTLAVGGHAVRLFGVRPPVNGDRCAIGSAPAVPCAQMAQDTLAARLRTSPTVTCRLPPGGGAAEPGRICTDAKGTDLARLLVAEGLALADGGQTDDYTGAEGVARSFRKGLWLFR
jgi:endonuclease YncB( thermonuclease family)